MEDRRRESVLSEGMHSNSGSILKQDQAERRSSGGHSIVGEGGSRASSPNSTNDRPSAGSPVSVASPSAAAGRCAELALAVGRVQLMAQQAELSDQEYAKRVAIIHQNEDAQVGHWTLWSQLQRTISEAQHALRGVEQDEDCSRRAIFRNEAAQSESILEQMQRLPTRNEIRRLSVVNLTAYISHLSDVQLILREQILDDERAERHSLSEMFFSEMAQYVLRVRHLHEEESGLPRIPYTETSLVWLAHLRIRAAILWEQFVEELTVLDADEKYERKVLMDGFFKDAKQILLTLSNGIPIPPELLTRGVGNNAQSSPAPKLLSQKSMSIRKTVPAKGGTDPSPVRKSSIVWGQNKVVVV